MSEFTISSSDFKDGEEIPKKFGYKFENKQPDIQAHNVPENTMTIAVIMDDPDAMAAVGKVWVHWLVYDHNVPEFPNSDLGGSFGKGLNDFGEIGYGGPAPPNGRHTYIFKGYALDVKLDLKKGYSKQELENAMKGHILVDTTLTGTFMP